MNTRILSLGLLLAFAIAHPLLAAEEGDTAKPAKATPQQIKIIKGVLDDLCRRGQKEDAESTYDTRISGGEQLLEIGAPAVPCMVEVINGKKTPFATKLYLVALLGRLGVDREADVTLPLCSMLQNWVTNTRYSKGGTKNERTGVIYGYSLLTVYQWSLLPCEVAKALAQIADPKAVPTLTKMMAHCRPKADLFYTQEKKSEASQFACDVMTDLAIALAMTEDKAAKEFIDKGITSSSPSLRVKSNLGRTMSLLNENRKTGQDYLRERIDEERNTVALDEYRKFYDRNCLTEQERKAELEQLREKLHGKPKEE